jgi:hypothetical protein
MDRGPAPTDRRIDIAGRQSIRDSSVRLRSPRRAETLLCWTGAEPTTPHGRADHQTGAHQHEVLHDVLPLECQHERDSLEGEVWKEEHGHDCARHLQQEQKKRRPQRHPGYESDPDQALPCHQNER